MRVKGTKKVKTQHILNRSDTERTDEQISEVWCSVCPNIPSALVWLDPGKGHCWVKCQWEIIVLLWKSVISLVVMETWLCREQMLMFVRFFRPVTAQRLVWQRLLVACHRSEKRRWNRWNLRRLRFKCQRHGSEIKAAKRSSDLIYFSHLLFHWDAFEKVDCNFTFTLHHTVFQMIRSEFPSTCMRNISRKTPLC